MHATAVAESSNNQSDSYRLDQYDWPDDGLIEPRKINVLVIEDDDTDYQITARTLQLMDTFSADTRHARNIVEAREILNGQQFDVALVDFCLGLDTGTRAIQELGGRIGSAALILLTGMPGQDIRQIALKAGAIDCIDKNQLNPALLETTIRSALHTHTLEGKLNDIIVELELASRAKTDFFARIGHDLKTPLNAILGYAQMMSGKMTNGEMTEKHHEFAKNICVAGTHLLEVLDNLIHHAANQGSYAGGQFEAADLRSLAKQAIEMAEVAARARKHDLKLSLCDEEALVNCQPSVLTQAILNLTSNAVKYTPPGGRIRVTLRTVAGWNEVTVEDNGIGMSREDIDVALRPFGRVSLPPQYAQDGTGIGLPIVRDIVATHAGQLDIESTQGEGTTVTLRLPVAEQDQSAA